MEAIRALQGLRVLEAAGWNGVMAGRLLADGGADVVRVVPADGDPLDAEPPFFGPSGQSIQSTWYNAGKRMVAVDLSSAAGRGRFLELVAECDVLIEDWRPGRAPFTEAELSGSNPGLTRVSVTPMGLDGPNAGLVANDLVANALSGSASVTGTEETPPLSGYGNQSHHTVGLYAAICALSAHRVAKQTARGQHVDLSAHEALVSCTEQVLMQWFFPDGVWKGPVAKRQGSLHWTTAYEVYPASDGHGVMITAALRLIDVLIPWLDEEGAAQDLTDRGKYPDVFAYLRDLPHVMQILREFVASKTAEELFYEGQRRHQPLGVAWSIADVIEKSPQIVARGYLVEQEVPGLGKVPFPGRYFRTDADGPHPSPGRRVPYEAVGWLERGVREAAGGEARSNAPLAGVRVLDFTHVLAGPFGTRVLGDLGADVIKVGTAARAGGANSPEHPYYVMWNRNKRSVTINMASAEGRDVARKLAGKADAIIENFSAGVLKRWGLDREGLQEANPGVSVIAMGGMGQSGPWSNFVTFAPTIHALTGLTYLTNTPGRHDMGYGFSLTDHLSGLMGAYAALQALEHRERTGEGLSIDLSQYELGLGLMAPALIDYLANGTNPEPVGNRHPFGAWAPHGIYRCEGEDAWVAIAVRGDRHWAKLCDVMGRANLAGEARFATHEARIANQDELDRVVGEWTVKRDPYAVMDACQAAGIAAGAVQNAEDLMTRDRQLAARWFFGTATAAGRGEYGIERFPARFNGRRPEVYQGVRQVGEDTFDVMTGVLGLSDDEVAALMASGALS